MPRENLLAHVEYHILFFSADEALLGVFAFAENDED